MWFFSLVAALVSKKAPTKWKWSPFSHTLWPRSTKKHEISGPVRVTLEKQAPKRAARPDEHGHLSPGQYLLQFMKKP